MSTVTLKNVYKIYDNKDTKKETKPAVSDFSMHIEDKEFIVFVGPSGCGKSTTLRMIAGLEQITDGEIYIDDVLVNDVAPKDRDIAMVFQNYALYPHMSQGFLFYKEKLVMPVYIESKKEPYLFDIDVEMIIR